MDESTEAAVGDFEVFLFALAEVGVPEAAEMAEELEPRPCDPEPGGRPVEMSRPPSDLRWPLRG